MFANNPQLQDQIRTMMPQLLAQLQNPEMQQMMSNPQVTFILRKHKNDSSKKVFFRIE